MDTATFAISRGSLIRVHTFVLSIDLKHLPPQSRPLSSSDSVSLTHRHIRTRVRRRCAAHNAQGTFADLLPCVSIVIFIVSYITVR